jgi:hypothetical protein
MEDLEFRVCGFSTHERSKREKESILADFYSLNQNISLLGSGDSFK